MSELISLLVFVVVVAIVIWLVKLILASIPNKPAFLQPVVIVVIALIAFVYLFGGYAPWLPPRHAWFR